MKTVIPAMCLAILFASLFSNGWGWHPRPRSARLDIVPLPPTELSWKSGKATVTLSPDGMLRVSGKGAMRDYSTYVYRKLPPWDGFRFSITGLAIEEGVTRIGAWAFEGLSEVKSVTIPGSVIEIKSGAFYKCRGLTSMTIPGSVKTIGVNTFYGCTGLTSVTIEDGVEYIGELMFASCTSLTSVTIPRSVKVIGLYAFDRTNLTSVAIPHGVVSIGSSAFENCRGLTSVTIPRSTAHIGWSAFSGCRSLTSVKFEGGVKYTGIFAFSGCANLTSVIVLSPVPPYIEDEALEGRHWRACLYVPEGSIADYRAAKGWKSFKCIKGLESAPESE